MENHHLCLKLILCLFYFISHKHATSFRFVQCNDSIIEEDYLENSWSILSVSNKSSSLSNQCLSAEKKSFMLVTSVCDEDEAFWIRYSYQLINLRYRLCVTLSDNNEFHLESCNLNNPNQLLTCKQPITDDTVEFEILNQTLTPSESLKTSQSPWKLRNTRHSEYSKFCNPNPVLCGPPEPGVNSFIVNSETNIDLISHLPNELIYKFSKITMKRCFSSGEQLLITCDKGYVNMYDSTTYFLRVNCLNNQQWNPSPNLHCRKLQCKRPLVSTSSLYYVRGEDYSYGDVITYICNNKCYKQELDSVCQYNGLWSKDPPVCKLICMEELHDSNGIIQSPNYPNPYPTYFQCRWKIHVLEGQRIALWFVDFQLESGAYSSTNCKYDVLMITETQEGTTKTSQLCGSLPTRSFLTSGNLVTLQFYSDFSYVSRGFMIEYSSWSTETTDIVKKLPFNSSLVTTDQAKFSLDRNNYNLMIFMTTVVLIAFLAVFTVIFLHFGDIALAKFHADRISDIDIYAPEVRKRLQRHRAKAVFETASKLSGVSKPSLTSILRIKRRSIFGHESSANFNDVIKNPEEPEALRNSKKLNFSKSFDYE